jgi:hypothetical protein
MHLGLTDAAVGGAKSFAETNDSVHRCICIYVFLFSFILPFPLEKTRQESSVKKIIPQ